MFDNWIEAFENDEVSAVIMLDMSAAFDVVDIDILLSKLALYGFEDSVLTWIRSYLSDRSQCVFIEGCLSEPLPLECGVPQGSILGPLLPSLAQAPAPAQLGASLALILIAPNHPPSQTTTQDNSVTLTNLRQEVKHQF